jgi:hypothetical protein
MTLRLISLRNSAPRGLGLPEGLEDLDPLVNAELLSNAADGWVEAPYADVQNSYKGKAVLQRLDKSAAEQMVALFNSWRGKLARVFGGVPVFIGHPDYSNDKAVSTDAPAHGWVKELQAGDTGLRLRIDWGPTGQAALANAHYKWWSPHFMCQATDQFVNAMPVYIPRWLTSVGLTNSPRWPVVPLANDDSTGDPQVAQESALNTDTASRVEPPTPQEPTPPMNLLQRIIALLGGDTTLSEDDVVSAVQKLIDSAKATMEAAQARWDAENAACNCDTAMPNSATPAEALAALLQRLDATRSAAHAQQAALANAHTAADTARQQAEASLAAFRTAAAAPLVDAAVAGGRVLPAHREEALASLVNAGTPEAFTAAAVALANAKPALKVAATAGVDPRRDTSMRERQDQVLSLVNAHIAQTGTDYNAAFTFIRRAHPALFLDTVSQA